MFSVKIKANNIATIEYSVSLVQDLLYLLLITIVIYKQTRDKYAGSEI